MSNDDLNKRLAICAELGIAYNEKVIALVQRLHMVERSLYEQRPAFECGRCLQLHAPADERGEPIPEHSPRCPMREERAAAWDAGYVEGLRDNEPGTAPMRVNPHRQ